jgi:hypothetical protein
VLLRLAGAFAPGAAGTSRPGLARLPGQILCCCGGLAMVVFAVSARHFLLLAGQLVFTLLCVLGGVFRKPS